MCPLTDPARHASSATIAIRVGVQAPAPFHNATQIVSLLEISRCPTPDWSLGLSQVLIRDLGLEFPQESVSVWYQTRVIAMFASGRISSPWRLRFVHFAARDYGTWRLTCLHDAQPAIHAAWYPMVVSHAAISVRWFYGSISVLLPTLRLVAHASARLDAEINPAAAILATRSEMDGGLPEYLLFPSEFIFISLARVVNRTRRHQILASNIEERAVRDDSCRLCCQTESLLYKMQQCRITNQLRVGRLRQCFVTRQALLRGSVCTTEFIRMRFRICQS